MAKESWSARIEAELKKEIQEFIKDSEFTNEDLVVAGFEKLQNPQIEKVVNSEAAQPINKHIFTAEKFDISLFEEIDISNLRRFDLQIKLCRIYFWKPYDILMKMRNGKYLFVVKLNNAIDEIYFRVIGEETEEVVTLRRVINEVENIEKIFQLKQGSII